MTAAIWLFRPAQINARCRGLDPLLNGTYERTGADPASVSEPARYHRPEVAISRARVPAIPSARTARTCSDSGSRACSPTIQFPVSQRLEVVSYDQSPPSR